MSDSPHYFSAEHEAFRHSLREFLRAEVEPHAHRWDEEGTFSRELYRRLGALGALGIGFDEAYGGTPADTFFKVVLAEEYGRCAAGGVVASVGSHTIALPPLLAAGSEALKRKVVPPVLRGERIAALAVTEPGGGSDVAALRCRARRDGDAFVVDGEKTFITSGMRADYITLAVRTDPASRGASGISLLLVETDAPGLRRTPLQKMGWWSSDTAHLQFENFRVPASHLIGGENEGSALLMDNFNSERLFLAVLAYAYAQACFDEALDWARSRRTFGEPLSQRQAIRHKLVDMAARLDAARCLAYDLASLLDAGRYDQRQLVGRIAMAKVLATETMQFCADQAVQILGGMGFMRGTRCERLYREAKVMMIGGGSVEILKDLAARQWNF